MSEIDPWALPQGGASTKGAGIPGTAPVVRPGKTKVRPLSKVPPIVVMSCAAAYTVACVVEIFIVNSQISLVDQLQGEIGSGTLSSDQVARLHGSDTAISAGNTLGILIYAVAMVGIVAWQARIGKTFRSVGARGAVLKRAGYQYFQLTWVGSLLLGAFFAEISKDHIIVTVQSTVAHDHLLMVYCGVRAAVGVLLVYFAYRLKKITEEGVARLAGAYA